ncbi:MAG: ABC transporter permease subunit [Rhodospirillaceae bacterium]|nr:ABC transporter permease subunit [Rhodospirillaceae bacterium]
MRRDIGRLAPAIALLLLGGSITAGLFFMMLSGVGFVPALGGSVASFDAMGAVLSDPRLPASVRATLTAGIAATLVALVLAIAVVARLDPLGTGRDCPARWSQRLAVAILATPHAALALGLAFLLAPSGWIVRLVNLATGLFPLPPDLPLIQDRHGFALAVALVIKETPFLIVALLTALGRIDARATLQLAGTLGYGRHMAWIKLVLPQAYPLVRFPVLAVLAYGLSVVDMSLILGPASPPTLPVLILQWANDPDLARRFMAGAGAVLQLGLVAGALILWRLGETVLARLSRGWLVAGRRIWPPWLARVALGLAGLLALLLVMAAAGALIALITWSVAAAWHYPSILPDQFTAANWQRAATGLAAPLGSSIALALTASGLSLLLAVACLEHEKVLRPRLVRRSERLLFLPLLVPDISFLVGIHVLLLLFGLNGRWPGVLWLHLLFVFPYVFLALKEPWRQLDPRFERVALALGTSTWRTFWCVKVPLLAGPLAWSAAIGGAVSLSLYLPTVLAGEGRIVTLASEAITLSSGGDRRVVGVYGVAQATLTGLVFLSAMLVLRHARWRQP